MAKRRRRSKKWISWLIVLILMVVAGVVCYFVWDGYFKEDKQEINTEAGQTEEIKAEEVNIEVIDDEESGKKVKQYDGEDPNKAAELSGAITYSAMNGNNLVFRVNIDQYLSGGECMLLLKTAGNIEYSNTVPIVAVASTATCEGFEVPTTNLSGGKYTVEIELTSGERAGKITGEIEF